MKKKFLRVIALCLAAVALLSAAACTGTGSGAGTEQTEQEVKYTELDLSGYTLVRPEKAAGDFLTAAVSFRKSINAAIGKEIEIKEDWIKGEITDEILEAKEILIGQTNRPQSAEALTQATSATGFVIALIGNKLVINAASDEITALGMEYFTDHLLGSISGTTLKLEENYLYVSDGVPSVDVVAGGKSEYKVVYYDKLDNSSDDSKANNGLDYEVNACKDLRTQIESLTGVRIDIGTDWSRPGDDTSRLTEILVGITTRPETAEFLSSINYDEYGFAVVGNKVVVTGWNLTTVKMAVDKFSDYLKSAVVVDADGKKGLSILSTVRKVYKNDGWFTSIPEFAGGSLEGTSDAGYQNLEFCYKDTTDADYRAYCTQLEQAGYTLAMRNDIKDNLHSTYTGSEAEVHVYFVPDEKRVRIITAPKGKYELPPCIDAKDVAPYTKITETKITQMNLNYAAGNFGMCYIITLEDGSFIIYDGGGYNSAYGDDARLYNLLQELNVRPDGKIVIAGWFLTHDHWDHFTNFNNMVLAHGSQIKIEACYMNTASDLVVYNANNPNYYVGTKLAPMQNAVGGSKTVKLHTGMKFYIRNAEIEVLYTQEDVFPDRVNYFNETSMVTRMTVAGQTILWFGDAKTWASNGLCNRYGTYVESDICQVAHHGYDGATQAVYNMIKPDTLLWPTSISNQTSQTAGSTSSYYGVDLYIAKSLGVKTIIVAEPTQTITLPFKAGDAIYKNKY